MNCACIKNLFQFEILASDSYTFIFMDMSEWMQDDHYILPDEYTVTVKSFNGSVYDFQVKLGTATRVDVPFKLEDGAYTFTTTSCGVTYTRYRAITPALDCCLNRAKINNPNKEAEIDSIEKMLFGFGAEVELGKVSDAKDTIKIIQTKMYNLQCDCWSCNK